MSPFLRNRQPREDGAAAAELAILMLVIVPTVLYSMWIVDTLALKLEVQEAVTSTGWDYTSARYDWDKEESNVTAANQIHTKINFASLNRQIWCDYTAAYDTPNNAPNDCNGDGAEHHRRFIATHMLWDGAGAKKERGVKCTVDRSVGQPQLGANAQLGQLPMNPLAVARDQWTWGGMWTCEATGKVYNYLVPNTFFENFTEVEQIAETSQKNLHAEYDGGAGVEQNAGEAHIKLKYKFAVLTDTWSMNDSHDRKLEDGCWSRTVDGNVPYGPYKRVKDVYSGDISNPQNSNIVMLAVAGMQAAYMGQALSKGAVQVQPPTFCIAGNMANGLLSEMTGSDSTVLTLSMRSHDNGGGGNNARAPGMETIQRPVNQWVPILTQGDDFHTSPWDVRGVSDTDYSRTWRARGRFYMGCRRAQDC